MNVLVCIKRVPTTGSKIVLTKDQQRIDTSKLGFAISPHEECAVEEAVRIIEEHDGSSTVLTLGPEEAIEQLRDAMAMGVDNAVLLETDGSEWDPIATADAIVEAIHDHQVEESEFDIMLFGNEAADTGGYQVGIRVAYDLDLPCVTGIKSLEIKNDIAIAKRESSTGSEIFEVSLPAVFTIKEGINLPRYPPLRGRLNAKKKGIKRIKPQYKAGGLEKVRLVKPEDHGSKVVILGEGTAAVPKIIEVLKELRIVES